MVSDDDADESSRPVPDQTQEVFQVGEKRGRGFDGDADDDGGDDDGEEDALDAEEEREQHLKVERDGVHCGAEVADHAEGEDDGYEAAEATGRMQHGGEDTACRVGVVALLPGCHVWRCAADCRTENHQGDRGES